MQGTRVPSLVWDVPTYLGATKPVGHNSVFQSSGVTTTEHRQRAHTLWQEKALEWEALALQVESRPCLPQVVKSRWSNKDSVQTNNNKKNTLKM